MDRTFVNKSLGVFLGLYILPQLAVVDVARVVLTFSGRSRPAMCHRFLLVSLRLTSISLPTPLLYGARVVQRALPRSPLDRSYDWLMFGGTRCNDLAGVYLGRPGDSRPCGASCRVGLELSPCVWRGIFNSRQRRRCILIACVSPSP